MSTTKRRVVLDGPQVITIRSQLRGRHFFFIRGSRAELAHIIIKQGISCTLNRPAHPSRSATNITDPGTSEASSCLTIFRRITCVLLVFAFAIHTAIDDRPLSFQNTPDKLQAHDGVRSGARQLCYQQCRVGRRHASYLCQRAFPSVAHDAERRQLVSLV